MTDPIADMLTRIRNAQSSRKGSVEVSSSKLKKGIAEILLNEGYIVKFEETGGVQSKLMIELKYNGRLPAIQDIKRISKPGHRVYSKLGELPEVLNGFGIAIISTPKGVMTNKQAKIENVGGEVICTVY